MSRYFRCRHCLRWCKRNPRIKSGQKYCGSRECQQARKNKWEQDKLRGDPDYKSKRQASKRKWYLGSPGHGYQKGYRESHPGYCEENRRKQILRNQKRQLLVSPPKIVNTDALTSESVVPQGLYKLLPYLEKTDTKKIVKTDALIVQIVAGPGFGDVSMSNTS